MKGRTVAEWVTFGLASAIVLLVIGLVLAQVPGTDSPPQPTAQVIGAPSRQGSQFSVPVEVTNEGDATAENVQIAAALEVDGETFEADQVVDFLAGGESAELTFVFPEDPESGKLEVTVTGYSVP